MVSFMIGLVLSLLVSLLAYKKKSLDKSGFITAVVVGTVIYYFGTYLIFTLLMCFFISSSLVTKKDEKYEKEGRNFYQVIVNALVAVVCSVLYFYTKNEQYLVLASIGLAAANSDTWASEIGGRTKGVTRSIVTFKRIEQGESGGISLLGTLSALLGSFFIAVVSYLLLLSLIVPMYSWYYYLIIITIAGFIGDVIDSLLGVLVQEKYLDSKTNTVVEHPGNRKESQRISGIPYFNNNIINLISTVGITIIFYFIINLI